MDEEKAESLRAEGAVRRARITARIASLTLFSMDAIEWITRVSLQVESQDRSERGLVNALCFQFTTDGSHR